MVFATISCSIGTGIYALCLYGDLNDFKGVFLWKGDRKRAGGFDDAPTDNEGGKPYSPFKKFHSGIYPPFTADKKLHSPFLVSVEKSAYRVPIR